MPARPQTLTPDYFYATAKNRLLIRGLTRPDATSIGTMIFVFALVRQPGICTLCKIVYNMPYRLSISPADITGCCRVDIEEEPSPEYLRDQIFHLGLTNRLWLLPEETVTYKVVGDETELLIPAHHVRLLQHYRLLQAGLATTIALGHQYGEELEEAFRRFNAFIEIQNSTWDKLM